MLTLPTKRSIGASARAYGLVGVLGVSMVSLLAPDLGAQSPDTARFSLISVENGFALRDNRNTALAAVLVPRDALIPADEEQEAEEMYVKAFNYEERTTAFDIGDGRLGVHTSSYEIMREGSAGYAGGRDKFLIYDPRAGRVSAGGVAAGVTTERIRYADCFWAASHTRFVIADVNGDGLIDLGLQVEGLPCPASSDDAPASRSLDADVRYRKQPMRWFVLDGDRWVHRAALDGRRAADQHELPLIGRVMSSVDFARARLRSMATTDR
jgi:hypothetical protein